MPRFEGPTKKGKLQRNLAISKHYQKAARKNLARSKGVGGAIGTVAKIVTPGGAAGGGAKLAKYANRRFRNK